MKKPIHKRRVIWALVGLVVTGFVFSRLMMPEEFLKAQKLGEAFAESYPDAIQLENGINYVESGTGKRGTLFLIHGSPGHWQDFGRYLSDSSLTNDFLLVVPDRPGYGQTSPGTAVGSMSSQAKTLVQLAESRPRPWIWAGHSFGASIIARLAMDHPEQVDGLLFLAGAMSSEYEPQRWFHKLGNQDWVRQFLPEEIDVANQEAIAFASEFGLMLDQWPRIQCPTIIVHGRKDRLANYGHVDFAREQMTNAKLEIRTLEKAGHFIIWDHYETMRESFYRMAEMIAEADQRG